MLVRIVKNRMMKNYEKCNYFQELVWFKYEKNEPKYEFYSLSYQQKYF